MERLSCAVPEIGICSGIIFSLTASAVFVKSAGSLVGAPASNSDHNLAFGGLSLRDVATIPEVWKTTEPSVPVIVAGPQMKSAARVEVISDYGLNFLGTTFGPWY